MKSSNSGIWSLGRRYLLHHRRLFVLALLCGLIYGLMSGLGIPVIFEKVFKQIFEDTSHAYKDYQICFLAFSIPIAFFVRGVFGFLSTYWMNRCGVEILKNLRADVFAKLQTLSLVFFDRRTSGDLINRVISDPKSLQDVILEIASEFFKQPLQMIAAFIGLIYLSIQSKDMIFLLIFLFAMPICFLPVRLLRKRVKENGRQMQQAEADMTECVAENLRAVQEVRTFRLEEMMKTKAEKVMQHLSEKIVAVIKWQKMQQPLMEVFSAIIIAVVFAYAYFKKVPFSMFSAMGTALYFAFDPIKKISNTFGQVHRVTGALERVVDILEAPVEIQDSTQVMSREKTEKILGQFDFRDVSFSYGGIQDNEIPALKAISLRLPAGSFCALVGPSGAGKSTFVKLLPRLYEVTHGNILLDGKNIRQWSLKSLRDAIAIVSQNPILFNDSVLNNLRMGNPSASFNEVVAAAKLAYADDFISGFENGYETFIGENGGLLSGGQRQRMAIARAFLKNAPILILDEATSALDSESEFFIRKALDTLSKNKTVVAIAHRISTIQHADKIFVFDHGHLLCEGSHDVLMQVSTLYKQLVEKQMLNV